jgi:hypothetical protein
MDDTLSPKLERLDVLIGDWSIEATFPQAPLSERPGQVVFERLARVVRRYEIGLEDGVWTLKSLVPGFSQRFSGRFSPHGSRIEGAWEMSEHGSNWSHDFDPIYTRSD